MWKKLVTRESTFIERTLRFDGYYEFLPNPFTVKQKDLLAIYKNGMTTQYVQTDDFESKLDFLKHDLHEIGFEKIINKWDYIFYQLDEVSQKLAKSGLIADLISFGKYYKQSRAIILYAFNLAKLLKGENEKDSRIDILQKYYDEAEVKSSRSWLKIHPFVENIKHKMAVGDEIYSYSFEEFCNFLSTGVKIDKKILREREELSVILIDNYKYNIYFGSEAVKIINTLNIEDDIITAGAEISGTVVYKGKVCGRAVIIKSKEDYKNIQDGDVLITTMTDPSMVSYLSKVVAIVTDEGGILCHASIISREMRIPCVIATRYATRVLKDGDMVEVDADKGVVRIIK
jgi:phosphohistidine swiveling domain-containing protein